jgi:murein DD-endopeptidase MepM/ murein hydrolase activator NlpD
MEELNNLIEELQTKKQDLADKQEQLEKQKQELQSKYAVIQVQYQEEQSDGLDIQTQISEMKKLIKSYESSCGGKKNIDVSKCGAPAVDGWVYPLNSFYQSSSYAEFRDSYRHYAVDLAVSEGNSVKAVANGVVVASSLPSAKSSCYSEWLGKSYTNCHCGGYIIQIKHYYNGSYYISLYMHLLEGYVKTGDTVTKGQVIGISGGGVQEADKWSDYCTAGAHLHFSMSYGDSLIGYSSSQGSTFNPVKFFPAMAGQGSSY